MLKNDFEEAIEHYLSCCKESDVEPQIPCYDTLDVKIPPTLHKQLQIFALHNNKTQSETIADALRVYISA